jgi:hypothetical protein
MILCGFYASLLATTAVGAIVLSTPAGLSPGDTFRFIFVTSGTTTATHSNIAVYNNFVTSNSGGATYNGSVVAWKALVSTPSTLGLTNVGGFGSAVPVYTVNGLPVASDMTTTTDVGFYGNPRAPAIVRIDGSVSPQTQIWTGMLADGSRWRIDNYELGGTNENNFTVIGESNRSDQRGWLGGNFAIQSTSLPIYAVSAPLTAIPEPKMMGFATGLMVLILVRCFTKRRHAPSSAY